MYAIRAPRQRARPILVISRVIVLLVGCRRLLLAVSKCGSMYTHVLAAVGSCGQGSVPASNHSSFSSQQRAISASTKEEISSLACRLCICSSPRHCMQPQVLSGVACLRGCFLAFTVSTFPGVVPGYVQHVAHSRSVAKTHSRELCAL